MTVRPLDDLTDRATLNAILYHPDLRAALETRGLIHRINVAIEQGIEDPGPIDFHPARVIPVSRVKKWRLSVDDVEALEMDPGIDGRLLMHIEGIKRMTAGPITVWDTPVS